MSAIKSLELKNFQSHKNLKIDFSPNVTSIIGPSDVGKSAIIRALRWIVFNRPAGDAFIQHGTKQAEVIIQVEKDTIIRTKGKENLYKINVVKL